MEKDYQVVYGAFNSKRSHSGRKDGWRQSETSKEIDEILSNENREGSLEFLFE